MHDVDAGRELQAFSGERCQRADAAGAEIELARLGLRQRDIFPQSADRQVLVHQHHQRQAADDGDVAKILARVVGLLQQGRIDRLRGHRGGEPGVAVGSRLRDGIGADDAAAAGAVLDHERLAELALQRVGEGTAQDVGSAGRRRGRDQPHQPGRPLRLRAGGADRQQGQTCDDGATSGKHEITPAIIACVLAKRKHARSKIRTGGP